MAKQVRRLAIHKRLDPKSKSSETPYGKNMIKAQDSESEGEQEGRKNDFVRKNRWKNREARAAQDGGGGGGGERRGGVCSAAVFRTRTLSSKVMNASCRHDGQVVSRKISMFISLARSWLQEEWLLRLRRSRDQGGL